MSNILDQILERYVTPLMKFIRAWVHKKVAVQDFSVPYEIEAIFMVLYAVVKTRGQKTVVKFFPHEVADMEPACEMLHLQQSTDYKVPYIFVLWLSIIVMVPFDLTSIDSQKKD
jgi:tubulin-specific chaperone D